MFAVSDIPEDVKLNMTNLIAHDGISVSFYKVQLVYVESRTKAN